MPSFTRLLKVGKLASLPETRSLLASSVHSGQLQDAARRAVHDRDGLVRDMRAQATSIRALRSVVEHPATREIAEVGMLFLPGRYLALGWAATRATRKLRNHPAERPRRPIKNVTPPPE